jgi:hypothetical protein
MGYSVKYEVVQALANALSKGNPAGTGPVNITEIGHTLSSTVTDDELAQYIRWADEQIDGAISSMYRVPLRRVNKGTFHLALDAAIGDMSLVMEDASRFTEGDAIILRQDPVSEENLVVPQTVCVAPPVTPPPPNFATPPDSRRVCLWLPLAYAYSVNLARVERVRYPDPISKISAKFAASYLYDRHFAAQQEGNKSDFGKALRGEAKQEVNGILSGAIRLLVADANMLVGRRYYNPVLDDAPGTAAEPGKAWFTEQ